MPEKLDRQMSELRKMNFAPMTVVHSDCVIHEIEKKRKREWKLPLTEGANALGQVLRAPSVLFPSILTSKSALQKIGYLDERVPAYQEWETAIQLSRFCRFIHVQEPLFIYHRYSEGSISGNPARRLDGFSYILDKYRSEIHSLCGVGAWRRHLIHLFALCYDLGLWPKKDFYRDLMAMTPREEDRILVNLVINKMVDRDWPDAHVLLKSMHNPWSLKAWTVSVLLFFHCRPGWLVSIKKRMTGAARPAQFNGKAK